MIVTIAAAKWAPARAEGETLVKGKLSVGKSQALFSGDAPLSDAIVYLEYLDGTVPTATPGAELAQKGKAFDPKRLIVLSGTTVRFPNRDKVYHNVFSLSSGTEFDLGLYAQGASKSVKFTKTGVVDVFCNIHPDMVASILVLQNPHYAQVTKDGSYSLPLPPGKHTVVAWWPKGPPVKREVTVAAGTSVVVDLELADSGSVRHLNKLGQPYGRYK